MTKGKYFLSDERFLQEMQKNQLPYSYKKIGVGLLILSIAGLLFAKYLVEDVSVYRLIFRQLSIAALLVISITKDKIEDEMTTGLRLRSYGVAVIVGAAYVIAQPLIAWFVTAVIIQQEMIYQEMSSFQVLSFMLLIQIGFYEVLKRKR